jgi:hypothetical protein
MSPEDQFLRNLLPPPSASLVRFKIPILLAWQLWKEKQEFFNEGESSEQLSHETRLTLFESRTNERIKKRRDRQDKGFN